MVVSDAMEVQGALARARAAVPVQQEPEGEAR